MSRCRRCGTPIRWVTTRINRKSMPLDPDPTPAGNVVLDEAGQAIVLNDPDRDAALKAGSVVYRAHFASCPHYERTPR